MRNTALIILIFFSALYSAAETPESIYFKNRRERLMNKLGDGILIIGAAMDQDVNRSEYRQENYFWYLTGYPEPNAIAVIDPASSLKFTLYVSKPSFTAELYGGSFPSFESIKQKYSADAVFSIQEFPIFLKKIYGDKRKIYSVDDKPDFNYNRLGRAIIAELSTLDIKPTLDDMRIIKDKLEIEKTRQAVSVTCSALCDAYRICKPKMFEFEVEAIIEYGYRKAGLPMPAYRSIVGSGPNATILHYVANEREMIDGDLLLMDVGAESGMYAADVTRTIPVNGKFSVEQRSIYELVLKAEEEAIKLMKPGRGNLECHHRAVEIISEGLVKLGLMTDPNSIWQKKMYNLYRVNHWLGMDVHDVGSYGPFSSDFRTYMFNPNEKGKTFAPGMISTIEPGLYFRPDLLEKIKIFAGDEVQQNELDSFIAKVKPVYLRYMNIGVRIEDDILITEDGNEILSAAAPKSVQDIEMMMKK